MGFFDTDRWNEIWQTIARNRRRSIMTAMGIFWGIFMLSVMLGVGAGLNRMMGHALGSTSKNTMYFVTQSTSIPYKGMPSEREWDLELDDVKAVQALPETLHAAGMIFGAQHYCTYRERKGEYWLEGHSPELQFIMPQPVLFGRTINEIDMLQRRKVCVIGTQVWKDLFPGGEDPVGKTIKCGTVYFTIVGVVLKQGEMQLNGDSERKVYIPLSLIQQLFGRGNKIDVIALTGDEQTSPKEVEKAGKQAVFARHTISPDDEKAIWTLSMSELFESTMNLFRGIGLLTWIVGLGTLLAGIVGVSNIMLVLVKERTQEIGIRRALGAKPSAIIGQILSESFILTFIAGVIGLASAVGVLSLADSIYYQTMVVAQGYPDISFQISFGTGMTGLAILVAGSLAAGIIPANRALKIKAVDAIREE